MATSSIRFTGATPSTGVGVEALHRVLADLCSRGGAKEGIPFALKRLVEEEAWDLSGEAFDRFMDNLYDRINSLLESNEVAENLGALRAIDELIDVSFGGMLRKFQGFPITCKLY